MKLNKNILTIGFLSLMLYNTPFIAQNSRFDVIQKELTKQQRDLLQNEKEVMKANRKAFKASLTKVNIKAKALYNKVSFANFKTAPLLIAGCIISCIVNLEK